VESKESTISWRNAEIEIKKIVKNPKKILKYIQRIAKQLKIDTPEARSISDLISSSKTKNQKKNTFKA